VKWVYAVDLVNPRVRAAEANTRHGPGSVRALRVPEGFDGRDRTGCGISRQGLYLQFANKEALFRAAVRQEHDTALDEVSGSLDQ
jgi:hypothetical protein